MQTFNVSKDLPMEELLDKKLDSMGNFYLPNLMP